MPVTPPAEQLVLDYLRRVADAANRTLRSDERLQFMAGLRAAIERRRGEAGADKLSDVAAVLNRFGDPGALVEQERRRLAEVTSPGPPASADAGAEESGLPPPERQNFSRTGRGGTPAAPTPPIVGRKPRAGVRVEGGVPIPAQDRPIASRSRPGRDVPGPGGNGDGRAGSPAQARRATRLRTRSALQSEQAPAPGTLGPLTAIRTFPREIIALMLLGAGGLIYPFPLWPLGALVALTSRTWSHRDKWLGVAGPLGFTVVGVVVLGQLSLSHGFSAYIDAARHGVGYLIRFGAVLGAAYLAWRVRRGARAPKPPPWSRQQRRLAAGPWHEGSRPDP